jgi:taspase (threonine aspartase 1)
MNTNKWLIAVHCGAGYHNPKNVSKYKKIMSMACRAASQILSDSNSTDQSIEAVSKAISILEDCDFTNAGLGSNLTENGTVECDACIASGAYRGLYGSVGAVMGIRNPIQLAREIMYDANRGIGVLGRIKPLMLVGQGAWRYCLTRPHCQSIIAAKNENELINYLVTERSKRQWLDHSNRVKQHLNTLPDDLDQVFDTVGAICIDSHGNVCAGVSSGGISLKCEGRVGEAAIYGSGCLAEQNDKFRFAASCTGVGEDIMYNLMAQRCCNLLQQDDMFLDSCFTSILTDQSPLLPYHTSRNVGILALHKFKESSIELGWAYTTKTMAVGYMSSTMSDCVSFVSNNKSKNNSVQIGIISI